MQKGLISLILIVLGISHGYAQELSPDEKLTLERCCLEKVDDFISYLPEIASKKYKSYDEQQLALRYVGKALELFIGCGEDYEYFDQTGTKRQHKAAQIQTFSHGRSNAPISVKRYLTRLINLPYQAIKIDTCYAFRMDSIIHSLGDGLFVATGTMVYVTRAVTGDGVSIHDENCIKISLYVRREDYTIGPIGETVHVWSTGKLGDMKISCKT